MKTIATSLIFLIAATAGAATPVSPAWETQWQTAFGRAKAEQKMVLVDFWASWCRPCLRMDRETFSDPEVARRLSDFVLLKLDVDRAVVRVRQEQVSAFPSYGFYDSSETRRFIFMGFHDPKDFARKLDRIRSAAPLMLEAGRMLQQWDSAEAHLLLGNAYLRAFAPVDAVRAYGEAKRLAAKSGNEALAQTAAIQSAFGLAVEGKTEKALKLLQKEGEKPVNAACNTARLLAMGHIYKMTGNKLAAAQAFQNAIDTGGNDAAMKREAEAALASVQ